MVDMVKARRAASGYTDIHTDDPEEAEELEADEVYSVLAYCRDQLEILGKHNDSLDEVEGDVLEAIDALQDGMNKRAIQHLLGEVDDAE